jgi:hypothetical protein
MSAGDKTNLEAIFGKKRSPDMGGMGDEDEDGPSDDDVKKAKSDAFDAFFDAMHSKDKEGARKAWETMHGTGDDEEPEGDEEEEQGDQ